MHRLLALLVITVAIASGCGGGGRASDPYAPGASETASGTEAQRGGEARYGRRASGKELFVAVGCGKCHTLAGAGTAGTAGPNLDEHLMREHGGVDHIAMQIRRGGGGMPSFAGKLSDDEIMRIARFVHRAAGR